MKAQVNIDEIYYFRKKSRMPVFAMEELIPWKKMAAINRGIFLYLIH
jgi:hypothetical protein